MQVGISQYYSLESGSHRTFGISCGPGLFVNLQIHVSFCMHEGSVILFVGTMRSQSCNQGKQNENLNEKGSSR